MAFLEQVAIFLAAAVVVVPLARRAGMGSVLGYMLAGLIVGPWALDLVDDEREILHLAELGVVFLLFVIGLELQPRRLWAMRRAVFGLGGGQVALTALVLAGLAFALGLPLEAAVVAGLALSLSSTAFALQALAERNELTTRHGRMSFSILLFQDLAVIPILALLPLLAPASGGAGDGVLWLDMAKAVGMIALVVLGGRYLLRHVLRLVARFGTHEVFTATALLTVVGVALLMELVGLSMALGAFLAGVLLADSEYRHELEADIEPFKGLLLGLFFMAVGMTVNIGLVIETPLTVLGVAAGLMLVKMLCLIAVARIETRTWRTIRGTAVALSQGGEFAFVIVALGVSSALMDGRTADLLIVAVTLSMAATPVAFRAGDWLNARLEERAGTGVRAAYRGGEPGHHRRVRPGRPDRRPHPAAAPHRIHRTGDRRRAGRFRAPLRQQDLLRRREPGRAAARGECRQGRALRAGDRGRGALARDGAGGA